MWMHWVIYSRQNLRTTEFAMETGKEKAKEEILNITRGVHCFSVFLFSPLGFNTAEGYGGW